MKKEPLGLYIFRILVILGILFFAIMMYWSSALIEQDMKGVQSELEQIKSDISHLKSSVFNRTVVQESQSPQANTPDLTVSRKMDPDLPNLLEEDPFYLKTLPGMLGKAFKPHGTFRRATIGKPENLHPFSLWAEVMEWVSMCNVSVAQMQIGKLESYAPNMAIKVELRQNSKTGKPEFWVHLRDNVFWAPLKNTFFSEDLHLDPHFLHKHPVTAQDFKFNFDAIMNPYVQEGGAVALRTYFNDVTEIEVVDDFTFIVRWKTIEVKDADGKVSHKMKYSAKQWTGSLKPLASFVYQYFPDGKKIVEDNENANTYRTSSVWAQNFSHHWAKNIIVSCGPWIFESMTDREIRFNRNPDYYNPLSVLTENSVITFRQAPEAVWRDFAVSKLDNYTLQPSQLIDLKNFLASPQYAKQKEEGNEINSLTYVGRQYSFIGWNQAKVFFKTQKVRQALTMAIDRQRIINQNLNGMGIEINGTFFRYSPSYDASILPWPFDPKKARQLLAEEGWFDSQGSGVIGKMIDGKYVPFNFSLTYFVKNPLSKAISEYISTALKEIGIDCKLNGVDLTDLSATMDDKSFDALFITWGLGSPPEDPRQVWGSAGAKEKGSSNAIGFVNKEADEIMDKLDYEYDKTKRLELYHRFNKIIHEEAPYTFLYTPKSSFVYRTYLQNVFLPVDRQDLIPGANVAEPEPAIFWIKQNTK